MMDTKNTSTATLTRRDLLGRVATGMGTLGLAGVLAEAGMLSAVAPSREQKNKGLHHPPRAKRVIQLLMNGGPSHVDSFDHKLGLVRYRGDRPAEVKFKTNRRTLGLLPSPFKFSRRGLSGLWVSDLFPEVASCIDDLCVINSMHTDFPEHVAGLLMMHVGAIQPNRPSLGSWLTYGLGTENKNLPGFVSICHKGKPRPAEPLWSNSFLPGAFAGAFVDTADRSPDKTILNITNPQIGRREQRLQLDLLNRMNRLHLERAKSESALEARIEALELAFRMQFEAPELFDLSRESKQTRDFYGIKDEPTFKKDRGGRKYGGFAEGCLLARRLSERGVRVVQLAFGPDIVWDDHDDILDHRAKAHECDRPIAALLKDLKARGLLEDTLVLWGGEFGRTPTADPSGISIGRDHNHYGFTVWMAGGGVKGGVTYGATDDFGMRAVKDPVHVHDLHATILHLMGIDHEKLTFRHSGRDFRLTDVDGEVIRDILA